MGKISVVIPTHNRADLLPRAIKSVQNQTAAVDEIIVVSDGSTDNTDAVVNKIREQDNRIKLISYKPAQSGNYARNKGVEVATGEYIAFLDDDDEWLPQKIEKQLEIFRSFSEYGLVYTGQNCIFTDIDYSYITKPCWEGDLSRRIFFHNDIGTPSQVMVKASVLKAAGEFDLALGAMQDYDLWIRCCQNTKIGIVKEPCINYYNSTSAKQVSSNTEKYIKAVRYISSKYKDVFATFEPEVQKQIRACEECRISLRCLRNGEIRDARKFALAAIKIKPSKRSVGLFAASFLPYKTVLKVRSKFKY